MDDELLLGLLPLNNQYKDAWMDCCSPPSCAQGTMIKCPLLSAVDRRHEWLCICLPRHDPIRSTSSQITDGESASDIDGSDDGYGSEYNSTGAGESVSDEHGTELVIWRITMTKEDDFMHVSCRISYPRAVLCAEWVERRPGKPLLITLASDGELCLFDPLDTGRCVGCNRLTRFPAITGADDHWQMQNLNGQSLMLITTVSRRDDALEANHVVLNRTNHRKTIRYWIDGCTLKPLMYDPTAGIDMDDIDDIKLWYPLNSNGSSEVNIDDPYSSPKLLTISRAEPKQLCVYQWNNNDSTGSKATSVGRLIARAVINEQLFGNCGIDISSGLQLLLNPFSNSLQVLLVHLTGAEFCSLHLSSGVAEDHQPCTDDSWITRLASIRLPESLIILPGSSCRPRLAVTFLSTRLILFASETGWQIYSVASAKWLSEHYERPDNQSGSLLLPFNALPSDDSLILRIWRSSNNAQCLLQVEWWRMDSEGHVVTRGKRGGDDDENCKANINTPSLTASITIPLSNDAKKEVICHGYSDGQLWIIPTGYVLFRRDCFSRLSAVTVLQLFGHYAAVTSLFLPLFSSIDAVTMKPWLLSGSADGTVILWDYRRGTLLHRFYAHPTGVCHLLQPPPSTYAQLVADETNRGENINRSARPHAAISTKQKLFVKRSQPSSREGSASSLNSAESVMLSEKVDGNHEIQIMPLERLLMLVFSVGADNSVTLLNLEELTAPITLGSHPPIAALDFYTNGTVTVRCKHNTDSYEYFCWYIGVGLAQLESQSTSLSTNQFGRIVCTLSINSRCEMPKQQTVLSPFHAAFSVRFGCFGYILNIAHLPEKNDDTESSLESALFSCLFDWAALDSVPGEETRDLLRKSCNSSGERLSRLGFCSINNAIGISACFPETARQSVIHTQSTRFSAQLLLVTVTLFLRLIRASSHDLHQFCFNYLKHLSIKHGDAWKPPSEPLLARHFFTASTHDCRDIQRAARALFRSLMRLERAVVVKNRLLKWYNSLPTVSKSLRKKFSTFALAAVAIDELEQHSSGREVQTYIVSPFSSAKDELIADGRVRFVLNEQIKKELAFSLLTIMRTAPTASGGGDGAAGVDAEFTRCNQLAVEYLGKGWPLWESFFLCLPISQLHRVVPLSQCTGIIWSSSEMSTADTTSSGGGNGIQTPSHIYVLRCLFSYASASTSRTSDADSNLITDPAPIQKFFPSENTETPNKITEAPRYKRIERVQPFINGASSRFSTASANCQMAFSTRQALLRIADSSSALFINTMCAELATAGVRDGNWDRVRITLKSGVNLLLKHRSSLLFPQHVPQLLESLIKGCLDPNIPFAIRDRLIGGVTGLLHEIIRLYPTVGFNTQSQRLAVGTAATSAGGGKSGQIVIWDLKTATRLQVIDAHVPHPISAVSFNRLQTNGSHELLLVSYAATENLVKVWQQPSGLFGTLVSAFSAVSEGEHRRLPSGGNSGGLLANIVSGGSFKMFRSFVVDSAAGATDIPARFEWSSDRSVKLIRPAPASSLIFTV